MNRTVQTMFEKQIADSKTEQTGGLSVRTDLRAGHRDISVLIQDILAQMQSAGAAAAPVEAAAAPVEAV